MDSDKKNSLSYRYFFILGNTPILSSAEIFAVLERWGIPVRWLSITDEVAVVETAAPIDPSALMATLGGTIKIGSLLPNEMTAEQWARSRKQDGRIVVGVSVYKAAVGVANARCADTLRTMQGEILAMKRTLKEEGRSPITNPLAGGVVTGRALRLVTTRDRILPSVALVTEHILDRGGELVALVSHKGIVLGETKAVQAFHEYRHRDMGRPGRDARRGMLPPKVAQIMVNLAGAREGGIILDPFCGSGTVLSEAALLGYNVVGSDISQEAVDDTKKNLDWITSSCQLSVVSCQLFVSDVRSIAEHLEKQSVDAIVTEPFLGPPLTGRETPVLLGKTRRDITALVMDAFQSFTKVVRSASKGAGGRVVMVLPVLGGELLPIDGIEARGWRLVPIIPDIAKNFSGMTNRGTILYSRADQHLAREITVWTPLEVSPARGAPKGL